MQTKHLTRRSGIYQLLNAANGKVYIGSAVDLMKRVLHHRQELRDNEHRNPKLQRAWRKYSEAAFEARVIEFVPNKADLIEREQYWIDLAQSAKNGYNCAPQAGSQLGYRYTPEQLVYMRERRKKAAHGFLTPQGAEVTVIDPRGFRDSLGMAYSHFSGLQRGVLVSYKGWSHVNAKPKQKEKIKKWEGFIAPDGKQLPPITNLRAFCREHGLDSSRMTKVHNGKNRSHKGYTHEQHVGKPYTVRKWRTYHGFINPDGEQQPIKNLVQFCKDNGLDHATMYKVMHRKGSYKQHKGWTYDPALERQDYSWK